MSEGNGWLVLTVTMGEEDPLHLIAAGVEHEVYVVGVEDGRVRVHAYTEETAVSWLLAGDIDSRVKVAVGGCEAEMWIKSTEGSKAKIAIRGPEVLVLRHKLWLEDNAA